MWAAIRYRRAQAVVLVLLSALIATCAVFAPLYQRALEQALLRTNINAASVADTSLVVRSGRGPTNPAFVSADLAGNVPGPVKALYGSPIGQMSDQIQIQPASGLKPSPGGVVARDGICDHLVLTAGSCPKLAGEVLVSAKDLAAWKWPLGQSFDTPIPGTGTQGVPAASARLRVVGAYEVVPGEAYWMGVRIDGKSGTLISVGTEQVPAIDDFVTGEATFTTSWRETQATMVLPLRRELFTLGNLEQISQVLSAPATRSSGQGIDGALVSTQLPTIIDGIRVGQDRLRVIVPLLMAQLGLLAAAILLLVAQAAVEQRRPEVALARLRGRSREGAGRLVMGELALTVALGLPLGFGLAVLLTTLVRTFLLPDGVPLEIPLASVVALAAAAAVCALAIWLAARPVQRQSVSALLRRVSRERGRAFGVVDVLAVALATFGLIGLATGSLDGPLALITPTLIALAAGLVASRLAVPIAGAGGRTNLRRGRVGHALTAFGLERRPTLRKVVTVVSVAVALTVFAANALVVAERNWSNRAQVQTGANVVIDTDSRNPAALLTATRSIDPTGKAVSPVAIVRRTDAASTATIAVVSRDLKNTSFPPPGTPYRLSALAPPDIAPVQLEGTRVTGRISWDLAIPEGELFSPPPGQSGQPRPPSEVTDGAASELRVSVTTPTGQRLSRVIGTIPLQGKGSARLNGLLLCPDGCRLDGLEFRKTDQRVSRVSGKLTITTLGVDGASLDLAGPSHWNPFVAAASSTQDAMKLLPSQGDTLSIELVNTGFSVAITHADVPAVLPGLLAGPLPPGGNADGFDAAGINGAPVRVAVQQAVDTLPVLGRQGVLVDYETLARLGGRLPDSGTLSVWLSSAADADSVSSALAAQGIGVLTRHTFAESKDRLDESASAWGLRLAAFTGAMGVLLAALVVLVMTVTGWRVVARDLAALHMSGVPLKTLRAALVREQAILVLIGGLVGVVCGTVSSLVAMPLVPLFDSTVEPVPALALDPSGPAILGAALLAGGVLMLVGWLAAVGAGRRITLQRLRDSL